ncbi:MAG: serine hydrolase [Gemmatimonadales bacterium]
MNRVLRGSIAVLLALALAGEAGRGQSVATLRARLEARIAASGAEVGLYFLDLDRGDSILLGAHIRFHAASTMKVPVLMQVFRDADAGRLVLDDSIAVTRTFASFVDGSPYALDRADDSDSTLYAREGGKASVRELAELMTTVSSNLATNLLIEQVGAARAHATAHALGADSIRVLRGVEDGKAYRAGLSNTTTARDLGVLFTALARGTVASPGSCREMLAILERQRFNEGIPARLPPGARVAHKTGSITALYHDAGIVTTPAGRRWVLVVLTRGLEDEKAAHELVGDLSRMVYEGVVR